MCRKSCPLVFELSAQDAEHLIHGVLLQVGLLDEHLTWCVEHALGGIESDILDGFHHPLLNLVLELVEVDVLSVGSVVVELTEDVDGIAGEHAGELDVETVLTDGQRHLLRLQIDVGFLVLLVELDRGDAGWAECALDNSLILLV